MPMIRLAESTTNKLKQLAIPLEDSFDSVINRLADAALNQKVYEIVAINKPSVGTLESNSGSVCMERVNAEQGSMLIPRAQPFPQEREHIMDESELYDLLGKIGKRIFVDYFRQFENPNISNQEMIAMLPKEYTFKSRTSRTSKSRRIFREGLEREALSIIADSSRIEPETTAKARRLLTEISASSS